MAAETSTTGASFMESIFLCINLLLGIGLLAYPYAMAKSGWVGLIILGIWAWITRYTAVLLGRIMDHHHDCHTYTDIGTKAFGKVASVGISAMFVVDLLVGSCSSYLIIFADNLQSLFPQFSITFLTIMGTLLVLPSTWLRDLSKLSYLSLIGVISSITLMIAVVYSGLRTSGTGSLYSAEPTEIALPKTIPFAAGVLAVGFGGHGAFPTIYMSMKNKRQYSTVLNVTFVVIFVCYAGVAVMGYLMYGQDTKQEITLNFKHGWLTDSCLWLIVISSVCKFALSLAPVSDSVEEFVDTLSWFHIEDEYDDMKSVVEKPILQFDEPDDYKGAKFTSDCRTYTNNEPSEIDSNLSKPLLPSEDDDIHQHGNHEYFDAKNQEPGDTVRLSLNTSVSSDITIIQSDDDAPKKCRQNQQINHRCRCVHITADSKRYLRTLLVRTVLTAFAMLIAIVVPQFDVIMSFIGSFMTFLISVTIPCSAYMILMKSAGVRLSKFSTAWNWTWSLLGVIIAIIGTVASAIGSF